MHQPPLPLSPRVLRSGMCPGAPPSRQPTASLAHAPVSNSAPAFSGLFSHMAASSSLPCRTCGPAPVRRTETSGQTYVRGCDAENWSSQNGRKGTPCDQGARMAGRRPPSRGAAGGGGAGASGAGFQQDRDHDVGARGQEELLPDPHPDRKGAGETLWARPAHIPGASMWPHSLWPLRTHGHGLCVTPPPGFQSLAAGACLTQVTRPCLVRRGA